MLHGLTITTTTNSSLIQVNKKCFISLSPFLRTSSSTASRDVEPPLRKHRDSTSVLRALANCVKPTAGASDFSLGPDPTLGSTFRRSFFELAQAKGRLAANFVINQFIANDVAGLANELPRINRLLPLRSPDSILTSVSDGSLEAGEAMQQLLLLLAPTHAWRLYKELAPSQEWSGETLHRLLDLLASTNNGFSFAAFYDTSSTTTSVNQLSLFSLPDPVESFYAQEVGKQVAGKSDDASNRSLATVLDSVGDRLLTEQSEVDVDDDDDSSTIPSTTTSTSWSLSGPAEQLFLTKSDILCNPRGLRSMIRGAAKFGNADRAMELANLLWSSSPDKATDSATFEALLRVQHQLTGVQQGKEDVWPHLASLLSRASKDGVALGTWTFSSTLFSLTETSTAYLNSRSPVGRTTFLPNYASIGLGLLTEMETLGLEPSLGVMSNLLKLLNCHFFALNDFNTRARSSTGTDYDCSRLLRHFIDQLTFRFSSTRPPSRIDKWHHDDFSFFSVAMRVAFLSSNLEAGLQLQHLLMGEQDRRFLLRDSVQSRRYFYDYTSLLLNSCFNSSPSQDRGRLINLLTDFYQCHRPVVVSSQKLCYIFVQRLGLLLDDDQLNRSLQLKIYHLLGDVVSDMLESGRERAPHRISRALQSAIDSLSSSAQLDPLRGLKTSRQMLTFFNSWLQSLGNEEATASNRLTTKRSASISQLVDRLVRATMPASQSLLTGTDQAASSLLLTTIRGWVQFVVDSSQTTPSSFASWSWLPYAVDLLWRHDIDIDDDFVFQALQTLDSVEIKDLESANASLLLSPIINVLIDQNLTAMRQGNVGPNNAVNAKNNDLIRLQVKIDSSVKRARSESQQTTSNLLVKDSSI